MSVNNIENPAHTLFLWLAMINLLSLSFSFPTNHSQKHTLHSLLHLHTLYHNFSLFIYYLSCISIVFYHEWCIWCISRTDIVYRSLLCRSFNSHLWNNPVIIGNNQQFVFRRETFNVLISLHLLCRLSRIYDIICSLSGFPFDGSAVSQYNFLSQLVCEADYSKSPTAIQDLMRVLCKRV